MIDRDKEKLEMLDGSRANANRRKAAVRIEDLEPILEVPPLKSASLSGTPTAADFNALRADVKALSDTINAISNALRKRLT